MKQAWHLMFLYNILTANAAGSECQPGFTGPTCKKQNIARGKTTYQTDTFGQYLSGLAVNGISIIHLPKLPQYECSHTDTATNASWSVNLSDTGKYNITKFTLYLRDQRPERYTNLRVLVDGNLCQRFNITAGTNGEPVPNPVYGQCNQPLRGNNVSVHVDNNYLTLCEVQIWVCSDGWFGVDCGYACKCLTTSETCDKETGYCRSGCVRGWHGDGCQRECVDWMYGDNCNSACGNCTNGDPCNKVNGTCHDGCQYGFEHPLCKECAIGSYGGCSSKCGHCENNASCDNVNGSCPKGCQDGYIPPLCQECLVGKYGDRCSSVCGNCTNGGSCIKENGKCHSGCQVGFEPPFCKECAVGFYGDCSSKCGHCRNSASCDNVTGSCPNGCQNGYISPLCQDITSSPVGAIVGGGVVAVLAVIAFALGIYFLRRKNSQARNKSSTNEDTQLEDTYERKNDGTENVYDTLRIYFNDDNTYTHISSVGNLKQFIKDKLAADGFENELNRCDDRNKTGEESRNNEQNNGESSCRENSPGVDSTRNVVSCCREVELYTRAKDPTHLTVNEFWKMIWQRKVTQIVMLTHSAEMTQSMQYWPEENGRVTIGGININSSLETKRANFTIRNFVIKQKAPQTPRRVTQFHFTSWPENSYPPIPSLLMFLKKVTKRNRESESDGPVLVHCRSKGGRTGLFIALHSLMTQVKKEKDDANLLRSVAKFLQTRSELLESEDQFEFVYETLLEALESRGTFYTQLEFDEKYGRDLTYTVEQECELRLQFQALSGLKKDLSQEVLSEALLSENISKNRCQNILPAIRTRPYLPNPVTGMNDYINAIVLTSYTRPASFLVTQTPLEETVEDFWRLVYHHNCKTIVCLDDSQDALSLYPRQNTSTGVGVFQIETVMKDRSRDSFTELHLSLSHKEQKNSRRDIRVLLTPISNTSYSQESSSTFLNIVQHLEDTSIQGDRKILVHCLDGSCMSGVFCSVMNIVSRLRLDKEVDIFLAIRELQTVRPQFVQTYEQYKLCYDVVKEYHRHSNTYINFGVTPDTDME